MPGAGEVINAMGGAYLDLQTRIQEADAKGDTKHAAEPRAGRDAYVLALGLTNGVIERFSPLHKMFPGGKPGLGNLTKDLLKQAAEAPMAGITDRGLLHPHILKENPDVLAPVLQEAVTGTLSAAGYKLGQMGLDQATKPNSLRPDATINPTSPEGTTNQKAPIGDAQTPAHSTKPEAASAALGSFENQIAQDLTTIKTGSLRGEEARAEREFADQISTDLDKAVADYEQRSPGVIDRDEARELFPLDRDNRTTYTNATTAVAGKVVDLVFKRWLDKPTQHGVVVFSAGGQSSGKTTARNNMEAQAADFIVDGTLQDYARSSQQINAVNQTGRRAVIHFVYSPFDRAVKSMVKRATEEGGRYVTVKAISQGHYQSARTVLQLAKEHPAEVELNIFENITPTSVPLRDATWLEQHLNSPVENLRQQAESIVNQIFKENIHAPRYTQELRDRIQGIFSHP